MQDLLNHTLSISEITEDRLVSALGIQLENLYGQNGNSSRRTVTELRDLGIKSKEIWETLCSKQIPGGDRVPWESTCLQIKYCKALQWSTTQFLSKEMSFVFISPSPLISTYFLLPMVSLNLFFMVHIFNTFFLTSLPFVFKTLLKPWGKHIRWERLSLQSC